MNIKGAIFDADGTLFDSMPVWDDLCIRYLKKLGITAGKDVSDTVYDMTLKEGCAYIVERFSLTQTPAEVRQELNVILADFYKNEVELKPGISELLEFLEDSGIPMVVATSTDSGMINTALDRCGIDKYFAGIFSCKDYDTNKRSPLIYTLASQKINTDPSEALVFEDSFFAMQTAKFGGFNIAAVEDDSNLNDRTSIKNIADVYFNGNIDAIKEVLLG